MRYRTSENAERDLDEIFAYWANRAGLLRNLDLLKPRDEPPMDCLTLDHGDHFADLERRSRFRRQTTENSTTKVIAPRAVTSTAEIVSHGVRFFVIGSPFSDKHGELVSGKI